LPRLDKVERIAFGNYVQKFLLSSYEKEVIGFILRKIAEIHHLLKQFALKGLCYMIMLMVLCATKKNS
jgi:hypothetical protein